jgi:SNF2 family DNA or RNA helicase
VSVEYPISLSELERGIYDRLKKDTVISIMDDDGEITAANAAALSNKLCQLAGGAVYDDAGLYHSFHSRKLDALEDLIESANGNPVLIAYWFRHDLDRIAERLRKLRIPFSRMDTEESIRRWNNSELPVGLIHPASAGHGLNIQAGGSALIWFGPTWSLELYQQTNARLWRQGQTSATVVIHHIIAKDTIDERIMKALSDKNRTQTALIEAVKAVL